MALIESIKHSKAKLAGYIKQAKKLFHGSHDGDRKAEVNAKAKEPREIAKAPTNETISKPVAATAITGAHVGDTEVVPNEGYDYDYWAWNELPPTPSEPPISPEPSTASAPELKGQEPTVDNGHNVLLEIASIGDSITKILQSASDSFSPLTTPASASASASASTTSTSASASASASALTPIPTPTTITTNSLPHHRAIWGPNPNLSPSSSSFPATSSYSSPAPPKRFQRSPYFGKKIGVTPRVSRIRSVSGALDPGSEWHGEDERSTLIEPEEGGLETFGAENGRRPFLAIVADLRQVLGLRPSPVLPPALAIASPPLSHEERYRRAFAMIRELRNYPGRPCPGSLPAKKSTQKHN